MEQTPSSCPYILLRMKPKNTESENELVARIEKEMNRPRLTESARADGEEPVPVPRKPPQRSL